MATQKKHKFTPELFDAICNELATSSRGLKAICEKHDLNVTSFYAWIRENEALLNIYTRAREDQADYMADEILEIADDASNDFMTVVKGDQTYELENKEWTSRSKLRVESRKWLAMKLKPKKYGDKVDVTTAGNPITPTVIRWGDKDISV